MATRAEPSRRRVPRAATVALALALAAAGCRTWRPVRVAPGAARTALPGDHVRVTRTDGSVYTLVGARVPGDSVVGQLAAPAADGTARRVAVALQDVQRVEARRVDPARTAGAVLGSSVVAALAALGALIVYALANGGFGDF